MKALYTCLLILAAIKTASGQQPVTFKCPVPGDSESFLTIYTTDQPSKVGERIQLSVTSKGITYWKVPLRAIEIEDGTVTYESRENVLINRHTGKVIPGKMQLLVNWSDDGSTYAFFPPHGMNSTETQGTCE